MRSGFGLVSLLAIALTGLPCVFYFTGWMGHESTKWLMLVGTLLWFGSTPLWMGRPAEEERN